MILRPAAVGNAASPATGPVPAWTAIEPTQRRRCTEYWLITQPDHAALSGDIAANLGPPLVPALDPLVVRGIAVHDDGWAAFDAQALAAPVSFLDHPPSTFLQAWTLSIDRAEQVASVAGVMVSRHFCRLGQERLGSAVDTGEDMQRIGEFLARERQRDQRLRRSLSATEEQVAFLVEVLQFCDLLSLYLCCGAAQDVEFPQKLASRPLQLKREPAQGSRGAEKEQAAVCRFDPSPFAQGVGLAVVARHFPPSADHPSLKVLPFLLW